MFDSIESRTGATANQDLSAPAAQPAASERYLLLCPTHRDLRELPRLVDPGAIFLEHDYASLALEAMAGAGATSADITDPIAEIACILKRIKGETLAGILSTDDYPGSTLAAVVASTLGLPTPSPTANLICQHKYFARIAQREFAPEAVPEFTLINIDGTAGLGSVSLPAMVKPVKSFFSVGAARVSSTDELAAVQTKWATLDAFFWPFDRLADLYANLQVGRNYLIAEELLTGSQCTLEGYAFGGEIAVLGVVDSIMFPATNVFRRFEYPSVLSPAVQNRMADITRRVMSGIGFRDGMFNIEFMYDPTRDRVSIIEINPRMSSQFADLFEKVDGVNSYSVLLDLARGRRPRQTWREGKHKMAASCVLRTFSDHRVLALPTALELDAVRDRYPDARVEVLATLNRRLSDEMQDGQSFRYGVINVGGADRSEVQQTFEVCLTRLTFQLAPL